MQSRKKETNTPIYLTIIAIAILYSLGTFLHDPILHGLIAYLNGWKIDAYSAGLMTGSTTVTIPKEVYEKAPLLNFWLYYMFPALFILISIVVLTFIRPIKWVMVAGIVLISLNLPSLNPEIEGSDAYSAAKMLASRGWSEPAAFVFHTLLFFIVYAIWATYLYVAIENNPKDAKRRATNVWR